MFLARRIAQSLSSKAQPSPARLSLGLVAAAASMTTAQLTADCNGSTAAGQAVENGSAAQIKHKVVFVLGGPGSGKGTQSDRLVQEFGLVHLSAGDLLREHMKSGTPDGQMVANMIANGQIVPSHVTISLLQKAMAASGKQNILIDGFPRNEENRAAFEKQTGIEPEFVLFFDCPEEVMERRLLGRNQGRTDDNIETIRKRFHVFLDQSMPIIEYYEKLGKVRQINADRDPDDIYEEVRKLFSWAKQ